MSSNEEATAPEVPDWDKYVRTQLATQDQTTNLPTASTVTLNELKKPLESKIEYAEWVWTVKSMLGKYKMLDLLDAKLDRPKRATQTAENWRLLSMTVGDWLRGNVSPKIAGQLNNSRGELLFADDIWKSIQDQMQGHGPAADLATWTQYHSLTAADYPETSVFIRDVVTMAATLKDKGIDQTPYSVLLKIIHGLEIHHEEVQLNVLNDLKAVKQEDMTYEWMMTMANTIAKRVS